MAYSSRLRQAVGEVRKSFDRAGIEMADARFAQHGKHDTDPDAPLVMVACSGGRDSMALAAVAHIVCSSMGLRCGAIIVDHNLQKGSGDVAAEAAQRCEVLGLNPVMVRNIRVQETGKGMEAAARQARYEAIVDKAHNLDAKAVLLAHTEDDQAETVLIGLMRSSGIDAVSGMPERFNRDGVLFLRPFLALTRAQTTGICEDLDIAWWDDPTNGEYEDRATVLPRDFPLRSRVRHTLLPYMQEFNGGNLKSHLAQSSALIRADKDYLDSQADGVARRTVSFESTKGVAAPYGDAQSDDVLAVRINAVQLSQEHESMRWRVIVRALSILDIEASSRRVQAIDQLIMQWHGQGPVTLPSGYSAFRKNHVIRLCQDS